MGLLFRARLEGLEHLPEGPFLLVSNHNAGMGLAEIGCFAARFLEQGEGRAIAGFAHPVGFRVWPLSVLMPALGCVPSTYEAAEVCLAQGVPILVFPGGDHETLRPVWQANRVDFGGRRGFLKIARKARVPVVPMGIRGSHYTAPMLMRSRSLAWLLILPRALGIKRWGVSLLGLLGTLALITAQPNLLGLALAWAWLASPFQFLPILPWTIRMRVGPPLDLPDDLDEALPAVEAAVQGLLRGP